MDKIANAKVFINYFMTEAPTTYKPVQLLCKSMDWFLYGKDLRHERVMLTCLVRSS